MFTGVTAGQVYGLADGSCPVSEERAVAEPGLPRLDPASMVWNTVASYTSYEEAQQAVDRGGKRCVVRPVHRPSRRTVHGKPHMDRPDPRRPADRRGLGRGVRLRRARGNQGTP